MMMVLIVALIVMAMAIIVHCQDSGDRSEATDS
jgi:hypothetical protein